MDGTLIRTKSGKTFPQNRDDWVLFSSTVPKKMRKLHEEGFKLALFTNQKGLSTGKSNLEDITGKIDDLQQKLGVPLLALAFTKDDGYRKPLPASWDLVGGELNGGVAIEPSQSMYCGDAAGRKPAAAEKKKKDFSDGDLKFARNNGVDFYTPEEMFTAVNPKPFANNKFDFDPRRLGTNPLPFPAELPIGPSMVMLVGSPGSGKSSIANFVFAQHTIINQDAIKSKAKCLAAAKEALSKGGSCIIDCQNKDVATRAPFLAIAKEAKVETMAVVVELPKDLCFHLNAYRALDEKSDQHRKDKVPDMVIHSFYKNRKLPKGADAPDDFVAQEDEGFDSVVTVGMEHFRPAGNVDTAMLRRFLR